MAIAGIGVDALFVLLVTAGVFVAFARAWAPPDVIAMTAVALLLLAGVLRTEDLLPVFSNSGPITVACMFVLSAALDRTGVIEWVGLRVSALAEHSHSFAIVVLLGGVMLLSAFMNNTPVVVVMTPVVIGLAATIGVAPTRLLIPLSYAAILGGVCTLIGTSTNLLADGAAQAQGLAAFGMFEITGLGLIMATVGGLYLAVFGRILLPDRPSLAALLGDGSQRRFLTEGLVLQGSKAVGRTLAEAGLMRNPAGVVIDIIRDDRSLRHRMRDLTGVQLEAGDRVVLQTHAREVMGLRAAGKLAFPGDGEVALEPVSTQQAVVMEGIVGPGSRLVGRSIVDLNLRRRYGVFVIAVHRQHENLSQSFDRLALRFGDTLLLEGPPEGIQRLVEDGLLLNLNEVHTRPLRRQRAPLAIAAIAGVMLLATLGIMPIAGLAIIATVAVVVLGCVRPDEIYEAIEWRLLLLIFGMLGLSVAMEQTGAVLLLVEGMLALAGPFGPFVALSMIYLMASLLTEMVSNNAIAVLMVPIAVGVAQQFGVDPRPFAVAVMFAASACFATPIGYQTNTFVYHAGNYRFSDFVKVGLPLNLLLWLVASALIPLFWPL
ncbi:SLC13 family permease [Aquibaculum arenosum]|uniref:SLC13 family permease n=1 Tax=Aquibaculum arenosum TaxID=3032591 RepID=A0ABT5YMU9_9PROT|nr:SLC13 family permease [Fodinicurvata sp. CAU 1616]MDF2096217.1 SLC13 family permease [Fodinicurvata sp. CAU 1616]